MNKKLSLFPLLLVIFASIVNLKNITGAALCGSQVIFFFIGAALLFFIPTAIVSAKLSALPNMEGGIYPWIQSAFGRKWAIVAVWLQWSNTLFWYPSMIAFIAVTSAYVISPSLADHKLYVLGCILIVFWGITGLNLRGIQASVRVTNICVWIGTLIPLLLLMLIGGGWLLSGKALHIDLSLKAMTPIWTHVEGWSGLVAIMASFVGIELAGVYVHDIKNPHKTLPRAIILAAIAIFFVMSLSSLTVAVVSPSDEINLISGVMQIFQRLLQSSGLYFLVPLLAFAITLGSIGAIINWLIAPARGLFVMAQQGLLPSVCARTNSQGVPSTILIIQALIVSVLSSLFLFQPKMSECFWIFTVVSTQLYMWMYIILLLAGIKLLHRINNRAIGTHPLSLWVLSCLGILGCLLTIVIGFIPPQGVESTGSYRYCLMVSMGHVIAAAPLFLLFAYQRRKKWISV